MGREGEKVMGVRREGGRRGQREEEEEGGKPSRIDSTGNKQPKPGGRIMDRERGRGWRENSNLSNLLHSSQGFITWDLQEKQDLVLPGLRIPDKTAQMDPISQSQDLGTSLTVEFQGDFQSEGEQSKQERG